MKKLYTLILFTFLFSGATNAQLTLTQVANEPVLGNVNSTQNFDSVGVIPKTTGASQTWSFSAFTANTITAVSTYTTASSTLSASSFPSSTLAEDDGNGTNTYFHTNSNMYELDGFADNGNGILVTFTNSAIAAQWPINYLYSNNDTYSGAVSLSTYSGAVNGTITTTAPGNGTVMLPGNQNFSNCLQVRTINNLKGTVNGTPVGTVTIAIVSTDYAYYNSTQKFPLITVAYSRQTLTSILGPTVTSTATSKINNAVYAAINEFTLDNSYSIYPNPASAQFNVSLENTKAEDVSVEIFNQLGQSVKKENLGNSSHVNATINTLGMTSGVYFVKTILGNKSSVKKLIIE